MIGDIIKYSIYLGVGIIGAAGAFMALGFALLGVAGYLAK